MEALVTEAVKEWKSKGQAVKNKDRANTAAGMSESGQAVHKVRLEPGRESTILHSHLAESEWLYILQGSAVLRLARPVVADEGDIRPPFGGELIEENREVSAGDFIGFRECKAGLCDASP